jgi:hypothetical protein
MEQIKNLYKGINFATIPKVILNELCKNSDIKSSISTRGKDGKMITTYGDYIKPLFVHFAEYNFYVNSMYIESFHSLINIGIIYDNALNVITHKNIEPFYIEYSKGFNKGYNEFEYKMKDETSLFSVTNEQLSHKVYSKIITDKKGYFPTHGTFELHKTDLEKKIQKEKNLKILLKVEKESFFESGFNGGEFYKAWELILNNTTIFEPIFLANAKSTVKQPEPEAIDHNYLGQPTNENANNFFDFLIEYYRPEETTQIKYVNILYYLKNDADKIHFIFNIKQNDYQEMIKSRGIRISKFSKSAKYEEVEKPIFYSLENTFLKEMNK